MWCQTVFIVVFISVINALVVQVPDLGSIQGIETKTIWSKRTIHEFRGIRYAEAPIGDKRFKVTMVFHFGTFSPYFANKIKIFF